MKHVFHKVFWGKCWSFLHKKVDYLNFLCEFLGEWNMARNIAKLYQYIIYQEEVDIPNLLCYKSRVFFNIFNIIINTTNEDYIYI